MGRWRKAKLRIGFVQTAPTVRRRNKKTGKFKRGRFVGETFIQDQDTGYNDSLHRKTVEKFVGHPAQFINNLTPQETKDRVKGNPKGPTARIIKSLLRRPEPPGLPTLKKFRQKKAGRATAIKAINKAYKHFR